MPGHTNSVISINTDMIILEVRITGTKVLNMNVPGREKKRASGVGNNKEIYGVLKNRRQSRVWPWGRKLARHLKYLSSTATDNGE